MNQYEEMRAFTKAFNERLLCTDFNRDSYVHVMLSDGCFFLWKTAFAHNPKGDFNWVAVYTEHHGCHLYDADDIKMICTNDMR